MKSKLTFLVGSFICVGLFFERPAFSQDYQFDVDALKTVRGSGNVRDYTPKTFPKYKNSRDVVVRFSGNAKGRIPFSIASTSGWTLEEERSFGENLKGQGNLFGRAASEVAKEATQIHLIGKTLTGVSHLVTSEINVYTAGQEDLKAGVKPNLIITMNKTTGEVHLVETIVINKESGEVFTYRNEDHTSAASPSNQNQFDGYASTDSTKSVSIPGTKPASSARANAQNI